MKTSNWYAVQVAAGCEQKAKSDLIARKAVLEDRFIVEVEVPVASQLISEKSGKRRTVKRLILPGYILVRVLQEEVEEEDGTITRCFPTSSQDIIRSTFNVLGFAGPDKKRPRTMSPAEVKNIFSMVDDNFKEVKQNLLSEYYIGDTIEVVEGPFTGKSVVVCDLVGDKIITSINIFNTPTRVELSKNQVYKK